jgi:biotin carboxyl carrier protein
VLSQVSGVVVSVDVNVGDTVAPGQQLVTLEAMKMNTYVRAERAGRVASIKVQKGASVLTGDELLVLS